MIQKNPKVKKFNLEPVRHYGGDTPYTQYQVIGLDIAYHGLNKTDYANGACGLIKQKNYPGYCQLCFVYHTDDSENFGNGCTVEFMPLITKDGERILVKYDHDSLFCTFRCGRFDYDKSFITHQEERLNATITFNDNGYCDLWDEEKTN